MKIINDSSSTRHVKFQMIPVEFRFTIFVIEREHFIIWFDSARMYAIPTHLNMSSSLSLQTTSTQSFSHSVHPVSDQIKEFLKCFVDCVTNAVRRWKFGGYVEEEKGGEINTYKGDELIESVGRKKNKISLLLFDDVNFKGSSRQVVQFHEWRVVVKRTSFLTPITHRFVLVSRLADWINEDYQSKKRQRGKERERERESRVE